MVTTPNWLSRYGLPAAFLLAATMAVLLVRGAIGDEAAAPVAREPMRTPTVVPRRRANTLSAHISAYSVRTGDTLGTIAERFGTTVDRLLALNPGIDPLALRVGQTLRVG